MSDPRLNCPGALLEEAASQLPGVVLAPLLRVRKPACTNSDGIQNSEEATAGPPPWGANGLSQSQHVEACSVHCASREQTCPVRASADPSDVASGGGS